MAKKKIVIPGGGHGPAAISKHLKKNHEIEIAIVVSVFDRGKHTGLLRDDRKIPALGDGRVAIESLSTDSRLRRLLGYRFANIEHSTMNGESAGNYFLLALLEICDGDIGKAFEEACRICKARGIVLPVSLGNSDLEVTFNDGTRMAGEGNIDTRPSDDSRKIVGASLTPLVKAYEPAVKAVLEADVVVLPPGDLWTSIFPNLLVPEFLEAIQKTRARVVHVVNLMTKLNETDGYEAYNFTEVLYRQIKRKFDLVICNNPRCIPEDVATSYSGEGASVVPVDSRVREKLNMFTKEVVVKNVAIVEEGTGMVRHGPQLAEIIESFVLSISATPLA